MQGDSNALARARDSPRHSAANPHLHQILAGTRRHRPVRVDIGVSVTGDTFLSPLLVLEGADSKTVAETRRRDGTRAHRRARQADKEFLHLLRRWGWLVPVGFLRRAIPAVALHERACSGRRAAGTFQVSTVPVDWALVSTFATSGVLVGGQVWSRVVAVDGQPAVRPIMTLTLSCDHGTWDGRAAARLLAAVKAIWRQARRGHAAGAAVRVGGPALAPQSFRDFITDHLRYTHNEPMRQPISLAIAQRLKALLTEVHSHRLIDLCGCGRPAGLDQQDPDWRALLSC